MYVNYTSIQLGKCFFIKEKALIATITLLEPQKK